MVISEWYDHSRIEILEAPDEIYVAQEFLDALPRDVYPWVSFGDGILTATATNGTVSYGLHSYDLQRHWWKGTRSGDWQPKHDDV